MKVNHGISSFYSDGSAEASCRNRPTLSMLRDLINPNLIVSKEEYDAVFVEIARRIDNSEIMEPKEDKG